MEVGGGWDEFEIVRIKYPGSSLLPSSLIYFSLRIYTRQISYIQKLDVSVGASLKLIVLNPEGRIWTMIASSVASVVHSALSLLARQLKGSLGCSKNGTCIRVR